MAVVRVGAIADIETEDERRDQVEIDVSEFADLPDGRRIVSHDGLGCSWRRSDGGDPWEDVTADDLEDSAVFAVTADGETGLARWARLIEACARDGVEVTVDDLAAAPFEVELSRRLQRRISA